MAYTERVIGDPKNISRRDMIAGVVTVALTLVSASALGGLAIGGYKMAKDYITKRINALYANDAARALRLSHKNEEVLDLYKKYLSPGAVIPARTELSHRLCHTSYGAACQTELKHLKSESIAAVETETVSQMAELR